MDQISVCLLKRLKSTNCSEDPPQYHTVLQCAVNLPLRHKHLQALLGQTPTMYIM
jgi:hypothetical protein